MRPLRFLLTLVTFVIAFFLLLAISPWRSSTRQQVEERGSLVTYFNWRTPSSLFPPSAIISLTDDNSTNFVARPAAFGPLLPTHSLSGQLWIGSGFGEDSHLGRGGGEGELGCSDVPGWDDGSWIKGVSDGRNDAVDTVNSGSGIRKRNSLIHDDDDEEDTAGVPHPSEDDGTDDYLHHPFLASDGLTTNGEAAGKIKKPTHADIQSLQESAEIAGKIVLLSRGGCGFLEKVKWAQRRGGIALIVGDDIRGGPLVTMYARGDTSNVTIPSLFTSHTTAQLLSSLMPSGNFAVDDLARLGLALGHKGVSGSDGSGSRKKAAADDDRPNFTTTSAPIKATSPSKARAKAEPERKTTKHGEKEHDSRPQRGWFTRLFGSNTDSGRESRRPPSSGNIGWVLQEFEDDEYDQGVLGKQASTSISTHVPTSTPKKGPSDGFQIGVQDWRDPDLVAEQREQQMGTTSSSSSSVAVAKTSLAVPTLLKGGSITPGSGSYANAKDGLVDPLGAEDADLKDDVTFHQNNDQVDDARGWIGRFFSFRPNHAADARPASPDVATKAGEPSKQPVQADHKNRRPFLDGHPMHDGLWVTLSPTSISSSPFFDTLLVLVVSPLVTLTVVYALLLLRSRIRRRRWRAPKSVVERLPVRTYQTMPSGSPSSTSSVVTQASATTPLLPGTSRSINTRSRPRARTTSEVPHGFSLRPDGVASPSVEQIEEKRAAGLAEWRRRYGGKQRECVVCLEEYVDGVSRVMSLPCGHEFHAECITPWLTTRRRTCPICKGDVVRSLRRNSNNGHISAARNAPNYSPFSLFTSSYHSRDQNSEEDHEDREEDLQQQAAVSVNDDPDSHMPVSREDEAFEDLERGVMAGGSGSTTAASVSLQTSSISAVTIPDRNR